MGSFGWTIYYLCIAWLIFIIMVHVVWRNWKLFNFYRSTRVLSRALPFLIMINVLFNTIETIYNFLDSNTTFIFSQLYYQIISICEGIILVILFIILLKFFGSHWLNRRKFRNNIIFGPYLTYGKDPTNSMTVHWGKGKQSIKAKQKYFLLGFLLDFLATTAAAG